MPVNAEKLEITQRCFVVGCPRSGTTLLQGVLAAHPRIMSFPETHFFMWAYPNNRLKRAVTWPAVNVRTVLKKYLKDLGRSDLLSEARIGLFDRDFHKSFVRVLDRLALDSGKDIWVEKTPVHLHYIDEIQALIPKAKFIHIVRNGADTVASLYKVANEHPRDWAGFRRHRPPSIEQCVARWNHDVLITSRWEEEANHFVIRYEELTGNSSESLRNLCQFLSIDYAEEMEKPEHMFRRIVKPTEAWKAENAKGIRRSESKFNLIFSEREKRYVLDNLEQLALPE